MDATKYFDKELGKPTFGRSLRAWRLSEELSQEQLAKKTGLSKAAISRFENGHDFPSSETLEALAKACKADSGLWIVYIVSEMAEKKGFYGIEVRRKKVVG